jgi:hypothetical protein
MSISRSLCITKSTGKSSSPYAPRYEATWASGNIAPCFLDLGTWWMWLVRFMHPVFYSQGKEPWYEPQGQSGCGGGEERRPPVPAGNWPRLCFRAARSPGFTCRFIATHTDLPKWHRLERTAVLASATLLTRPTHEFNARTVQVTFLADKFALLQVLTGLTPTTRFLVQLFAQRNN